MNYTFVSHSKDETIKFGANLGALLAPNSIVCFKGDLGAGKTTLIKGLAAGVGFSQFEEVNSPTFVYMNVYKGEKTIYHFDLYRLQNSEEFLSMGFDEYLYADGICCIEWSERIENLLPNNCVTIEMSHHIEENKRMIRLSPNLIGFKELDETSI